MCPAHKHPQIPAAVEGEGAENYWGDQTRVINQPNTRMGCAPREQTPVINQISKRFGNSVMIAVSNRGSTRWKFYKSALDDALLIRFVEQLMRSIKVRKVYPRSSTTCVYITANL